MAEQQRRPLITGNSVPLLFTLGEWVVINLSFLWLFLISHGEWSNMFWRQMLVLVNVCAIPALVICHLNPHELRALVLDKVARKTIIAVTVHALVFAILTTFLHLNEIAIRGYTIFYGGMMVGMLLFRVGGAYALKQYRRRGYNYVRVAIVGTGTVARRLKSAMDSDAGFGYKILAYFDNNPVEDSGLTPVYPVSDLEAFVHEHRINQIFFALPGDDSSLPTVARIADDNCCDFYYVPQLPRTFTRNFELGLVGPIPVISTSYNPLKSTVNRAIKRSFDIAVSSVFLCFYPLIYIPIAIAIKLSSPGPVYFRQERTGYLGHSFKCLKFRTMRVNAQADNKQATKDDPRKTRLGDFLRRTSLDELPQFINVWRGDMSLVGPRPHMLEHTRIYTELIDRYMMRHAVKPGITGWAQVNGYRGLTDELWKMERRVEHDVWYIENWSFLLDLKIMVRTVMNTFHPDKNAF